MKKHEIRFINIMDVIEEFVDGLVERRIQQESDWNWELVMKTTEQSLDGLKQLAPDDSLIVCLQMACAIYKVSYERQSSGIPQCHSQKVN